MHSHKPTILFLTEGAYPFLGGGISTWADILCRELEEDVNFIILAVTGNPFVGQRYNLSTNVKKVIHLPLWGNEEPAAFIESETPFSQVVCRKNRTDDQVIKDLFLPMFRDFMDQLFDPFQSAHQAGELLYGFWKYYRHFDYKQTLANPILWNTFKTILLQKIDRGSSYNNPHILDITFGKRWLYHFMMPLSVSIPRVTATHSTLAGLPAIISIAAKYEFGTPILLTDHGIYIRERLINVSQTDLSFFSKQLLINLSTFVTRAVYYHADVIAPVTSINSKWEQRFEADPARIKPIYNGVDTEKFYPRPKPDHTKGLPTVVAAAHVFPLKDIETMIRTCHLVRREIPNVQFLLYGSLDVDKPYTEKCKLLVAELSLEQNFKFCGYHNDPSSLFIEGDISILSSISEGFPYTVIESMSCGRPVVATDVGGVREAVEGYGILCKARNYKALADGVIQLLNDHGFRKHLAEKGRERVLRDFTIPKSVNSYKSIYQNFHSQQQEPKLHSFTLNSVNNMLERLRDV